MEARIEMPSKHFDAPQLCSPREIRSTRVRAPGAKDEDYFPGK